MKNSIVVVKVGSAVLISRMDRKREKIFAQLAEQISLLHEQGCWPIVVTSGAIPCGNGSVFFKDQHKTLDEQVASMVGQVKLMEEWQSQFRGYGMVVCQGLVTHADLRKNDPIAVLRRCLELRIIPIINENDAISDEEIRALEEHGDNDALAALLSVRLKADRLLLLTDVPGLCRTPPKLTGKADVIPIVDEITDEVMALATASDADRPTGMSCKLRAARQATRAGVKVHIADGRVQDVVTTIMGSPDGIIGTTFLPSSVTS